MYVGVPENGLDRLIRYVQTVKVRSESSPKSMPSPPLDSGLFEEGSDLALGEVAEVERCSIAGSENKPCLRIAICLSMFIQSLREWTDHGYGRLAPLGLGFVDNSFPDGLCNADLALAVVFPKKSSDFALPHSREGRSGHDSSGGAKSRSCVLFPGSSRRGFRFLVEL